MATDAPALADDLRLAHRLADIASGVALPYFARGVVEETKADGTPVSEADLATEAALIEEIQRQRPGDSILSEESGAHGDASRRWILDPIDGTFNFIRQQPHWGTHIAFEIDGRVVLGVVTRPVARTRWYAAAGHGAFRRDEVSGRDFPVAVSSTAQLAAAAVGCWTPGPAGEPTRRALAGATRVVDREADNILDLVEGRIDGHVHLIGGVWDHAPYVVIVQEAGGHVSDGAGGCRLDRPLRYSNGHLAEELDALLDAAHL